jgi:hypothetical protein
MMICRPVLADDVNFGLHNLTNGDQEPGWWISVILEVPVMNMTARRELCKVNFRRVGCAEDQ